MFCYLIACKLVHSFLLILIAALYYQLCVIFIIFIIFIISRFLGSVDTGGYLLVVYFKSRALTLGHFSDVLFWSKNCTSGVCIPSHIVDISNVLFEGFDVWYFTKKWIFHNYILFLVTFPDMEILQFRSVKYIC